jgi:hypothetical protein
MIFMHYLPLFAAFLALASPAGAQIRNPPNPRALELAAYIFAATNVCGYRLAPEPFGKLIANHGATTEDVSPQGPFGARIRTMFVIMSNGLAQHRETGCDEAWRGFGINGIVSAGVLERR